MYRYKIYIREINSQDREIFYHPAEENLQLMECRIEESVNEVGTLSMTIPPTHPKIDLLIPYKTVVDVYDRLQNNAIIFEGRITRLSESFNGTITCDVEGFASYVDDVIITPYVHCVNNISDLLQGIINQHNNVLIAEYGSDYYDGSLSLGNIDSTVGDFFYFAVDYGTTKQALDDVIEQFGGYYYINSSGEVNYFTDGTTGDYNTQEIWFGDNLLDHVREYDKSDIYSRVYPYGAQINSFDEDYEQEDNTKQSYYERVSLGSQGSGYNVPYVENQTLKDLIGLRSTYIMDESIQGYDNELDPQGTYPVKSLTICGGKLYKIAEDYLKSMQWQSVSFKVNAVDLSNTNENIEPFKITDMVRVHSKATGIDVTLPVTSMSIDLLNASNSSYELGYTTRTSLTGRLRG